MKPTNLQWLLCLGLIIGPLWALRLIENNLSDPRPPKHLSSRASIDSTTGIARATFDYHDFSGSRHRFACSIDGRFTEQAARSFGFPLDQEKTLRELDHRLKEKIEERAGSLRRFIEVTIHHKSPGTAIRPDQIDWDYSAAWKPTGERLPLELRKQTSDFDKWFNSGVRQVGREIFASYTREHGFELASETGRDLRIAYKGIAAEARPHLSDCFDKFVREAGAGDEAEITALLLAAFQEMEFELPPDEEDGLFKAGFWVPTQVLQLSRGDCDSKSAALCALWQQPGLQILMMSQVMPEEARRLLPPGINHHALLAIEAYPGINQATLRLGLRRYVLCEVVKPYAPGTAKLQPGQNLFKNSAHAEVCMTDNCFGAPEE